MKGYKASYDGKCGSLKYEVGKIYTFHGELKICERGFHFCEKPRDVLHYYRLNKTLKLFEVEALSKCTTKGDKTVTDKLKIVKEVPLSVVGIEVEYDEDGNLTHYRDNSGDEWWKEYDMGGNLVHYQDSEGIEWWNEYDEDGNKIHHRDTDGFEWWNEYDEKGNEIHFRNSNGYEWWKEYDEHENEIHFRDSNGPEWWKEYDENGNLIHYRDSDGYEWWNEYDEDGNEIHYRNINGYETWNEYDEDGNKIHYRDTDGFETWREYDKNGNEIHYWDHSGYERWSEYDENGNLIHYRDSDGYEKWNEYDEDGNLIHYRDSDGIEWSIEITDSEKTVTHYRTAYSLFAACGIATPNFTLDINKVTCHNCRTSNQFKSEERAQSIQQDSRHNKNEAKKYMLLDKDLLYVVAVNIPEHQLENVMTKEAGCDSVKAVDMENIRDVEITKTIKIL